MPMLMRHAPELGACSRMERIRLSLILFLACLLASWLNAAVPEPDILARIDVGMPLRDPGICRGPDPANSGTGDMFYLTGTVAVSSGQDQDSEAAAAGRPDAPENDGVYLWCSRDLVSWEPMGCVMTLRDQPYELYGPYRWLHKVQVLPDRPGENHLYGIIAPEIHYARGAFWLTISMMRQGTALMRSTTGDAQGPYELVDLLTTRRGDPSLFDDGESLWWVFDAGFVGRLKQAAPGKHTPRGRDSTFVLDPRPELMRPQPDDSGFPLKIGERGAFMAVDGGRYHLVCSEPSLRGDGTAAWDTRVAPAPKPDGPYGKRRLLIPGGGQATLFRDGAGQWLAA